MVAGETIGVVVRSLGRRWFLASLCAGLLAGLFLHERLYPLVERVPSGYLVAAVMLLTSLPVDLRRMVGAKETWLAAVMAIGINAAVAPCLGWLAGRWLEASLAQGLIVACALPCTLTSAIVWTRRGRGNEGVAALVTLVTNFGCFLVMPFWTLVLLGQSADVEPTALVVKLLLIVVAPMAIGQLLRQSTGVAAVADRHRVGLSIAAQVGVLLLATISAIEGGHALATANQTPHVLDWGAMLAAVVVTHVVLLALGWWLARVAGWGSAERLAVAICGSQKTLAAGLGIAMDFGPLAIFPLIAYHFSQLVIDTLLVDRIRRRPDDQVPASDF